MSAEAIIRLSRIDPASKATAAMRQRRRVNPAQSGARPRARNGIAGTECRGPVELPPSQ